MALAITGIVLSAAGLTFVSALILLVAAVVATSAMRVFAKLIHREQTSGLYSSLSYFIRVAYCWLLCAALLGAWAATSDRHGGIVGASRHAVRVGFIGTMVFAIGQRLLPAFCGGHHFFSAGHQ